MNATIKIKNNDIQLCVEPNAASNVLRFAIFNKGRTHAKFLYNNEIYPAEDVEKASAKYMIFEDFVDCDYNHNKGETIDSLAQFNLDAIKPKEPNQIQDYRFDYQPATLQYKSTVYTHEDIAYMIKAISPLITYPGQESTLQNYVYFEKKFVELQKPRVKKKEAEQNAIEEYFNF